MTWNLIAISALAVGCSARLGADGAETVDAASSSGIDGGGGGAKLDAGATSPDAASACPSGRKLYLHFGGITLTDAATSDSQTDKASWLTNASATIPPWRQNSADRTAEMQQIVDGIKARLAMTPIEVVMTRPVSGPYVMVVFGGYSTNDPNVVGTVGTTYTHATGHHDCGDTVKNDVGWVAERASDVGTLSYVADLAVGSIGWGLGLNGTTDSTDCMCGWANSCNSAVGACTLSSSIATVVNNGIETACPNQNPQNEVEAFSTKFCQP